MVLWRAPGTDVTGMVCRCEKVVTTSEKVGTNRERGHMIWEVSLVSENLILFSEGYIREIDLPGSFTNVQTSTVYCIECVYLLIKL